MANTSSRTTPKKTAAEKTTAAKKAASTRKKAAPKSKAQLTAEKRLADKAKDMDFDGALMRGAEAEISTAESWKGRREAVKIELPSGNVVLAINKGLLAFVEAGKIPNALMPLVQEGLREGQGLPPEKVMAALDNDPKVLGDMFAMQTIMVIECIVQPKFHEPPYQKDDDGETITDDNGIPVVDEAAKDPSKLYLDDLDFMDRNFLFQWIMGGTKDLERFREESASYVSGLSEGGEVGAEAE